MLKRPANTLTTRIRYWLNFLTKNINQSKLARRNILALLALSLIMNVILTACDVKPAPPKEYQLSDNAEATLKLGDPIGISPAPERPFQFWFFGVSDDCLAENKVLRTTKSNITVLVPQRDYEFFKDIASTFKRKCDVTVNVILANDTNEYGLPSINSIGSIKPDVYMFEHRDLTSLYTNKLLARNYVSDGDIITNYDNLANIASRQINEMSFSFPYAAETYTVIVNGRYLPEKYEWDDFHRDYMYKLQVPSDISIEYVKKFVPDEHKRPRTLMDILGWSHRPKFVVPPNNFELPLNDYYYSFILINMPTAYSSANYINYNNINGLRTNQVPTYYQPFLYVKDNVSNKDNEEDIIKDLLNNNTPMGIVSYSNWQKYFKERNNRFFQLPSDKFYQLPLTSFDNSPLSSFAKVTMLGVNANSQNVLNAEIFARFATNYDNQIDMYDETGRMPISNDYRVIQLSKSEGFYSYKKQLALSIPYLNNKVSIDAMNELTETMKNKDELFYQTEDYNDELDKYFARVRNAYNQTNYVFDKNDPAYNYDNKNIMDNLRTPNGNNRPALAPKKYVEEDVSPFK